MGLLFVITYCSVLLLHVYQYRRVSLSLAMGIEPIGGTHEATCKHGCMLLSQLLDEWRDGGDDVKTKRAGKITINFVAADRETAKKIMEAAEAIIEAEAKIVSCDKADWEAGGSQ